MFDLRTSRPIAAALVGLQLLIGAVCAAGCERGNDSRNEGGSKNKSVEEVASPPERPSAPPVATPPAEDEAASQGEVEQAAPTTSTSRLDQRIVAGTDGASFFLFHPADLRHRLTSPSAWPYYHFACQPEFEFGRLVAFVTGGDGGYAFRITDGELTDREKKWFASSWDFRYVVRHKRVYLDGGYALPSDNYIDESEDHPKQWIELPNGDYKVTVNAIEWHSEPGAVDADGQATNQALPSYVIQFKPVDDLESIEAPSTLPWLEALRDVPARESGSFADHDTFDEADVELADQYVVLVDQEQAPIPGCLITIEGANDVGEALYGARRERAFPDRKLVIASSDKAPCLGALATAGNAGKAEDGTWTLHFRADRLVTVTALEPAARWLTGKVAALKRPESTVSDERLYGLKRAFGAYARTDKKYRDAIANPDFEAERVASMNSAAGVTHILIHHIQMPVATRLQLLPLSDAERVDRLAAMLKGRR